MNDAINHLRKLVDEIENSGCAVTAVRLLEENRDRIFILRELSSAVRAKQQAQTRIDKVLGRWIDA